MSEALIWICGMAMGFLFGRIFERIAWNQLVQAGILPKPYQTAVTKSADPDPDEL